MFSTVSICWMGLGSREMLCEDGSGYVVGVTVHASPQLYGRFKKAYCNPVYLNGNSP